MSEPKINVYNKTKVKYKGEILTPRSVAVMLTTSINEDILYNFKKYLAHNNENFEEYTEDDIKMIYKYLYDFCTRFINQYNKTKDVE